MAEFVWVLPQNGKTAIPIGARILANADSRIKVLDDDLNEYWVAQERKEILGPMHPSSVLGVEDMTYLGELQEYSILRNLQIRYRSDLIYTYVGTILVAVNPYKPLPIYGNDKMAEYRGKTLGKLPPHVFAVADHSYESMRKTSEKRCIVVSGESGAGKTESTKLFLQYFANISPKQTGKEKQILDSNPILEAFGNAKTVCNDNSSRFGKYISIYFNTDGSINSAEIKHYLLEKSRIVSQNKGEENYHIFYALLNGLSESDKKRLKLQNACSYKYLNSGNLNVIKFSEPNPNRDLGVINSAMKVLNFTELEIWEIIELIAAILHLGNIEFETTLVSNVETVKSMSKEIRTVCSLLKVSEQQLSDSLTKKTISTFGDVVKLLSKQEAINSRDAFVKKIFGNLFDFIVAKINENLAQDGEKTSNQIGILDIFGFEAFDRNSFEQLCINYANERLQQFFIKHVFKIEQEQYAKEGMTWGFVNYPDNQQILNLLEGGPESVLSVINDSTKIPRGTDESMLDKLIELHSENENFLRPKFKNTPVFGIQHFAGTVLYDIKDIIEKNYDSYSMNMKQLVQRSGNEFLRKIFASDVEAEHNAYHKRRLETLASKFKNSLDLLMNELNECQPFFVRCIKPNEKKRPEMFDRALCYRQLQYSGMTEVTKVREAGYPVRYEFFQFVQQYRVLVPGMPVARKTDWKAATYTICQTVFKAVPKADYQLGRTKVFLKHAEAVFLESEKGKALYSYAVVIQRAIRGWLARTRYSKLKKAVAVTEKCWKERQRRIESYRTRRGFHRLQARLKSRTLILQYQKHIRLVTSLQAHIRGYLLRNSVKHKLKKINSNKKSPKKSEESITFKDFAKKYFQGNQNHKFSKKKLKTSLTRLIRPEEVDAAKAIWWTLLRYTKKVSEAKTNSKTSASAQIREILQAIAEMNSANQPDAVKKNAEKLSRLYQNWLKRRTTDVEKLHFVLGHGIKRPELRDEIYCQICKILTNNSSRKATRRGWEFLSCCIGCFPPSDLFLGCLKNFIRTGHQRYTSFCLFRLHRVTQNGCRTRPPRETELQAIRQQQPVHVEVFLKNGGSTFVKIDSATTAREMVNMVAKNIKLGDALGFSIVLECEMKHSSLGDGSTFVLDAVSECEQYISEVEGNLDTMPWRMYLKKEMFTPWYDPSSDEVSTNLIYHQIREGIITGEYGFQDPELPSVIAQMCYAEAGLVSNSTLSDAIRQNSPVYTSGLLNYDLESFEREVENVYGTMFSKKETPVNTVRTAIVQHAAQNWTLQFSKFFDVFGTIRNTKSNEAYPEVPLVVGVNYFGIFVIDESNEIRLIAKMNYPEIHDTSRKELADGNGYVLKIMSHGGVEVTLTFRSNLDNDFHQILKEILETLRNHSKFVMAVKDYDIHDKAFLELHKGDLITLKEGMTGQDLIQNSWGEGVNNRTNKTGNFLLESVWIIPTVQKPSDAVLKAIRHTCLNGRRTPLIHLVERHKHYTLESYAQKFFLSVDPQGNSTKPTPELWKYTKKRLEHPLLAKLKSKGRLTERAVAIFGDILRYMESEQEQPEVGKQLIRKIFTPSLENGELRDEIYCQIMKQLTANSHKDHENKIWELMWLLTGLFACEEKLGNEVKKFLQSRRTIPIARDCALRFYQVQESKARKFAPHYIEVEAVKNRPCQILHRVYFPDGTNKFFKIDSLSKFKELKEAILSRLQLSSVEEFNVFIEISERLFTAPDDYYVFDYLQSFENWFEANKVPKLRGQYKICFMKSTLKASLDKTTELKFIFPQEYSKYIKGYYEIPKEDIVQLAALLYKVYPSENKTEEFQKSLEKLIPSKVMNMMKVETWQKEIQTNYKNHHLLSSADECKMKFIRHLSRFSSHTLPYFVVPETSNLKNYMFYAVTQRAAG